MSERSHTILGDVAQAEQYYNAQKADAGFRERTGFSSMADLVKDTTLAQADRYSPVELTQEEIDFRIAQARAKRRPKAPELPRETRKPPVIILKEPERRLRELVPSPVRVSNAIERIPKPVRALGLIAVAVMGAKLASRFVDYNIAYAQGPISPEPITTPVGPIIGEPTFEIVEPIVNQPTPPPDTATPEPTKQFKPIPGNNQMVGWGGTCEFSFTYHGDPNGIDFGVGRDPAEEYDNHTDWFAVTDPNSGLIRPFPILNGAYFKVDYNFGRDLDGNGTPDDVEVFAKSSGADAGKTYIIDGSKRPAWLGLTNHDGVIAWKYNLASGFSFFKEVLVKACVRLTTPTPADTATATSTGTPSEAPSPTPKETDTATPPAENTDTPTPEETDTSTPTAEVTPTVEDTPTRTATSIATRTATAVRTATATAVRTATRIFTRTSTPTPSNTSSPTNTASPTASRTSSATASSTATLRATLTSTATRTATAVRTATATAVRTATGIFTRTSTPSPTPEDTSTSTATTQPSNTPTHVTPVTPTEVIPTPRTPNTPRTPRGTPRIPRYPTPEYLVPNEPSQSGGGGMRDKVALKRISSDPTPWEISKMRADRRMAR